MHFPHLRAQHRARQHSAGSSLNESENNSSNSSSLNHHAVVVTSRFQRMIAACSRTSSRQLNRRYAGEQEVVVIVNQTKRISLLQTLPQRSSNILLTEEQYAVFQWRRYWFIRLAKICKYQRTKLHVASSSSFSYIYFTPHKNASGGNEGVFLIINQARGLQRFIFGSFWYVYEQWYLSLIFEMMQTEKFKTYEGKREELARERCIRQLIAVPSSFSLFVLLFKKLCSN
jgi:hypothetical protein